MLQNPRRRGQQNEKKAIEFPRNVTAWKRAETLGGGGTYSNPKRSKNKQDASTYPMPLKNAQVHRHPCAPQCHLRSRRLDVQSGNPCPRGCPLATVLESRRLQSGALRVHLNRPHRLKRSSARSPPTRRRPQTLAQGAATALQDSAQDGHLHGFRSPIWVVKSQGFRHDWKQGCRTALIRVQSHPQNPSIPKSLCMGRGTTIRQGKCRRRHNRAQGLVDDGVW